MYLLTPDSRAPANPGGRGKTMGEYRAGTLAHLGAMSEMLAHLGAMSGRLRAMLVCGRKVELGAMLARLKAMLAQHARKKRQKTNKKANKNKNAAKKAETPCYGGFAPRFSLAAVLGQGWPSYGGHVGPRWGLRRLDGADLGPMLPHLESLLAHLKHRLSNLDPMLGPTKKRNAKTMEKPHGFARFWQPCWGYVGPALGLCWSIGLGSPILGLCWVVLGLGPSWALRGTTLGLCWFGLRLGPRFAPGWFQVRSRSARVWPVFAGGGRRQAARASITSEGLPRGRRPDFQGPLACSSCPLPFPFTDAMAMRAAGRTSMVFATEVWLRRRRKEKEKGQPNNNKNQDDQTGRTTPRTPVQRREGTLPLNRQKKKVTMNLGDARFAGETVRGNYHYKFWITMCNKHTTEPGHDPARRLPSQELEDTGQKQTNNQKRWSTEERASLSARIRPLKRKPTYKSKTTYREQVRKKLPN